ncbi:MAG TPA: 2-oxo acid dehydrogenase subunit E2, partial [Thermosynechococcaceae cyanobacterium]
EYSSGTFTISNLGMFGVDRFDAILPPGTGAILAIGASLPAVVATDDGFFGVKRQMQVNLTADHRIIYGAHAAAFLKDLAKLIETNVQSLTL